MRSSLSSTALKNVLFLGAKSVSGVDFSNFFFFNGFDDDFDLGEAVLCKGEVSQADLSWLAQLCVLLRSVHITDALALLNLCVALLELKLI